MTNNEAPSLNNIACGDPVEIGQVHPESAWPSIAQIPGDSILTNKKAALVNAALSLLQHMRAAGAAIEVPDTAPPVYILIGDTAAMGKLLPEATKPRVSEQADEQSFAAWLAREMPAGTVIGNPAWWAPRILRAVVITQQAAPEAPATQALDAVRQWDSLPDAKMPPASTTASASGEKCHARGSEGMPLCTDVCAQRGYCTWRASSPSREAAPMDVKPWVERAKEAGAGYGNYPFYMQAEITDLRAALAQQSAEKGAAS